MPEKGFYLADRTYSLHVHFGLNSEEVQIQAIFSSHVRPCLKSNAVHQTEIVKRRKWFQIDGTCF